LELNKPLSEYIKGHSEQHENINNEVPLINK